MFCNHFSNAQTIKEIPVVYETGGSVGKQIQKALDTALEDPSGQTQYIVSLPAGTYQLDTLLKVHSNTTIKMNGCTLIRQTDKTMLRIGLEDVSYSGYNGQHDIRIEGGTFDGNGKDLKSSASPIRMGHGRNISFENVTVSNVYNSHHVELAGCENVSFENCEFKDFNGKGVNGGNNEALQFDILHNASHFPKYPGFDDTPCQNVVVNNCRFKNLQRGLGTHSAVAGSYFNNMKFTNNHFEDIKGYAIIATAYKASEISNNTIEDCGAGILFRNMVQGYNNMYTPINGQVNLDNDANSVISDNVIRVKDYKYATTAYGISLYGEILKSKKKNAPKGNYTLENVTVANNTITMNNSGYGIWLQTANNCLIDNNTVNMDIAGNVAGKGNSDCIRLVKSKKITISNNAFNQKKNNKKTNKACGIVITTGSNAKVANNTIQNSPKDGIFVVSKSSADINSNTIKKTGRYGVFASEKSTVTAKKNKISKTKGDKLRAGSDSKMKK